MNKKLAIVAIACVISIVLGGLNNSVLFGTQYLTTKPGYSYTVGEAVSWWDCNWSYAKKITIDHTMVQAGQTNFPVLLYESSDADLAAYAQSDGGDIVFVDSFNLTQYDHELEKYTSSTGEMVAWVEVASLSSSSDTILYMYYGNPDCANQWNISGTWNSNYKMVQHLNETSDPHYDSTANDNDGTTSGSVTQDTTYANQLDGSDYFPDGTGVINFGNATSLEPSEITIEAWVKDPPVQNFAKPQNSVYIADKKHEQVSLFADQTLHIERTIAADFPTEVIFVALYSPGVLIKDMNVDDSSVFSKTYKAGKPRSEEEQEIENIRKILPTELQQLQTLSYSKSFTINNEASVKMQFNNIGLDNIFSNGKISYLVISKEGNYDYECTTHWHHPVAMIDWWNPFSIFKSIGDFLSDTDLENIFKLRLESHSVFDGEILDDSTQKLSSDSGFNFELLSINNENQLIKQGKEIIFMNNDKKETKIDQITKENNDVHPIGTKIGFLLAGSMHKVYTHGKDEYKNYSIPKMSNNCLGEKTSTAPCFLRPLSPENIGQLNFNAKARYGESLRLNSIASGSLSEKLEKEINLICFLINKKASNNSSFVNLVVDNNLSVLF